MIATVVPSWFTPVPEGMLTVRQEYNSRLTGRWIRAQTAFYDRPPTSEMKTGYCAKYVPTQGRIYLDGIYEVGLKYKYDRIGLEDDAKLIGMDFDVYIKALSDRLGDVITLKDRKEPYIVDTLKRTCTCPDHMNRGLPCFHLMAMLYGIQVGVSIGDDGTCVFRLGGAK